MTASSRATPVDQCRLGEHLKKKVASVVLLTHHTATCDEMCYWINTQRLMRFFLHKTASTNASNVAGLRRGDGCHGKRRDVTTDHSWRASAF